MGKILFDTNTFNVESINNNNNLNENIFQNKASSSSPSSSQNIINHHHQPSSPSSSEYYTNTAEEDLLKRFNHHDGYDMNYENTNDEWDPNNNNNNMFYEGIESQHHRINGEDYDEGAVFSTLDDETLENQSQYQYSEPIDVCLIEKYNSFLEASSTVTDDGTAASAATINNPVLDSFDKSSSSSSTYLSSLLKIGSTKFNNNTSHIFCNQSSDGILCWPETLGGQIAVLPCSFQLNGLQYDNSGTATRICETNGIWLKSDYGHCMAVTTPQGADDSTNLHINTIVYLCGYTLSLCFLFLAIIIFISFKELYCLRNKIHTQLILTYIFADTLWIITNFTGSQASTGGAGQHVSCVTFILLHYFHVTNFFWMFVEGLYLYILVVQTFIADNIKLRTYTLIGWGIPLLILFIWSIAKWLTQAEIDPNLIFNDPEFVYTLPPCPWLNISVYDWIYKAPVIFVLVGNIIFLFQIMWVLITKLRSAMNPETQQSRKAAKALLVLMPLLGITYLLILTGSKQTPIYENIRALLISTQGFLVALLYCFCNNEVRTTLRHRWANLKDWCRNLNCCGCEFEGLQNVQQMRDSSPRSRTESIKLYTPNLQEFRKRESSGVSDITTMSTLHHHGSLNGSPNLIQTLAVSNKSNGRLSATTIPLLTTTDTTNWQRTSSKRINTSSNNHSTIV